MNGIDVATSRIVHQIHSAHANRIESEGRAYANQKCVKIPWITDCSCQSNMAYPKRWVYVLRSITDRDRYLLNALLPERSTGSMCAASRRGHHRHRKVLANIQFARGSGPKRILVAPKVVRFASPALQ
jgi:hypothetical protein